MKTNCGYYKFFICDKKLKRPKCYLQHRFVYESVKGLIPEGFEISHKKSKLIIELKTSKFLLEE